MGKKYRQTPRIRTPQATILLLHEGSHQLFTVKFSLKWHAMRFNISYHGVYPLRLVGNSPAKCSSATTHCFWAAKIMKPWKVGDLLKGLGRFLPHILWAYHGWTKLGFYMCLPHTLTQHVEGSLLLPCLRCSNLLYKCMLHTIERSDIRQNVSIQHYWTKP